MAAFFHGKPSGGATEYWEYHAWPDRDRIEFSKHRDVVQFYLGRSGTEVTYKGRALMPQEQVDVQGRDHLEYVATTFGLLFWKLTAGDRYAAVHPTRRIATFSSRRTRTQRSRKRTGAHCWPTMCTYRSPTRSHSVRRNAMPLTRRVKMMMLAESAISATTVLLVAARAVANLHLTGHRECRKRARRNARGAAERGCNPGAALPATMTWSSLHESHRYSREPTRRQEHHADARRRTDGDLRRDGRAVEGVLRARADANEVVLRGRSRGVRAAWRLHARRGDVARKAAVALR